MRLVGGHEAECLAASADAYSSRPDALHQAAALARAPSLGAAQAECGTAGYRIVVLAATVLAVFSVANVVYQVVRKPTEIFFPVSATMNKLPAETWRQYAPLFREYSTATITPELLAALAQVEGAGNPVARTYWRWRLSWNPFAIYQPASSAVGMYQMTDAAFAEARAYCIRHHTVVQDGCWFERFYTRAVPSHAIELTAVFLDRNVGPTAFLRAGPMVRIRFPPAVSLQTTGP